MSNTKKCTKCGIDKPNTVEFFDTRSEDKLTARCSDCRRLEIALRYKNTPKSIINERARKYRANPEIRAKEKLNRQINKDKERLRHAEYYAKNTERIKRQGKEYRLRIKDKLIEKSRKFYLDNKKSESERKRLDRIKNPEKYIARSRHYYLENKSKILAKSTARELLKISRTPKYLTKDDLFLIDEFYDLASLRTVSTGIKWEVDHISPLKGKLVSGFHTPWNLQVIPRKINRAKHDKFTPGDFPIKTNFFGD